MPGHDRIRVIDPLTFILAFDPETDAEDLLVAAVQLLRTQAVCVELESDADVDIAGIRSHLGAAVDLLTQFDKVTKALSQAGASLETVRSTATKLRNDLMDRLQRGLRLVDSSAQQSAA
jgi:hypothetical protein